MAKRVCTRCKAIYDPRTTGARAGRCPTCSRIHDRERGSREERGYGAAHRHARAAYQARMDAGEAIRCWRCAKPIANGEPWDLGHDDHDRNITRGPEHATCNRSAAGRARTGVTVPIPPTPPPQNP